VHVRGSHARNNHTSAHPNMTEGADIPRLRRFARAAGSRKWDWPLLTPLPKCCQATCCQVCQHSTHVRGGARAQYAATGTRGDRVRTHLSPTLQKGAGTRASLPTYPRYPCEGHLLEGGVPLRASARNTHTCTAWVMQAMYVLALLRVTLCARRDERVSEQRWVASPAADHR
jgi:hypothetical protein